jgi:hypothetical protein
MAHLVVIGPDNIIRGHIADIHIDTRSIFLRAHKAQQTEAHESSPGADDVTFAEVADLDDISAGFEWDAVNERGIPDQATADARAQVAADADDRDDARAVLVQLREIAKGPPGPLRVIARAVFFLVVRALREAP